MYIGYKHVGAGTNLTARRLASKFNLEGAENGNSADCESSNSKFAMSFTLSSHKGGIFGELPAIL